MLFRSAILVTCLFAFGCSEKLQPKIYRSLARDLELPTDEKSKNALYAQLRSAARLDETYTVLFYNVTSVALQTRPDDFYDSMVFLRSVQFKGGNGDGFLMKEEIYSCLMAERRVVLRRR